MWLKGCESEFWQEWLESQDSLLVKWRPCDWKVASLSPSRSDLRVFFSIVHFLCRLLFSVCPPDVTAVTHKRSQSFCQKCRWQVTPKHAYTHNPLKSEWVDYALHAGIVWKPNREISPHATHQVTLKTQSSQLAEPLWTNPGLKSSIGVHDLISTLKKKKKNVGGEWIFKPSWSSQVRRKAIITEQNQFKTAHLSVCNVETIFWFGVLSCK